MGRGLMLCAAGVGLCVVFAAAAAIAGEPPSAVTSLLLLAFVPYAGLLRVEVSGARPLVVLAVAAGLGLLLVAAPSVLSDDIYRYLWDARVLLNGFDPYAHAPDSPALSALRDDAWSRVNHREIPTIYPPFAQLYFALGCALWPSAHSLKLLALLCHLASVALVTHWVTRRSLANSDGPEPVRVACLLALNPLALSEAALGGHVDAAVGLAVLSSVVAFDSARHRLAVAALVVASGLKLIGLALWPLLLRARAVHALLALGLGAAMLWPLLGAGEASQQTSGLQHYSQRWRGNEGAFAVLELGTRALVDMAAQEPPPEGVGPSQIRLTVLRPWLTGLQGGRLDPAAALLSERKQWRDPSVFDRGHLSGLLARALAAGFVLALAAVLALRQVELARGVRWVLLSLLLLAPQLHPWYLLWLLPLELALGKRVLLFWSAAVFCAYAPLDGWLAQREWVESMPGRCWQYGWVALSLLAELMQGTSARLKKRAIAYM